jgi:hypothetical protein
MSGRWHSRWDGIAHRYHEPRRDFPALSLVIGTFIVAQRHGHGSSSGFARTPAARGSCGLDQNSDAIRRPVAGILRSPCDDASSLSREALSSFTSRSPRIRRGPKGAGALRLLQASSSRRPSTTHRSSCRVGPLRIGDAAPIAAPVVEQVVEREIIDGLRLGPRPELKHSPSLWQSCAISVIFYGATAKKRRRKRGP